MGDELPPQLTGRIFYKSKDADEFAQKLKEDLSSLNALDREEDLAWRAGQTNTLHSISQALDRLAHSMANLPNALAAVLTGSTQGQAIHPPPPPDPYRQPPPANPT